MFKLKTVLLACAAALAMPTVAAAGPGDTTHKTDKMSLTDADRGELLHRHHVNVMEIQLGKLAAKNGGAEVKKYAATLIADHTKADKDVRALARTRSVTLSDMPMSDDADRAAHDEAMQKLAKLEGLKGAEFDREFIAMMVDGHNQELTRVATGMPMASDEQFKALLGKTQGSLQKHLDLARAIQQKVGGPTTGTTPATGTGVKGSEGIRGTGTGTGTGTMPGTTGTTGTMRGTGSGAGATGPGTGTTGTMRGTGTTGTMRGTGTSTSPTTGTTGTGASTDLDVDTGTGKAGNSTLRGTGTTPPGGTTGTGTSVPRNGTDIGQPDTSQPASGDTGTTRRPPPNDFPDTGAGTGSGDSVPTGPGTGPITDQPIGPTPPGQ
jgi:predicted outer membrane protein